MDCMMAALGFRRRLLGLDGKRNSRFLAEFLVKNDVGWGRELRGCCEKFGYPGLLETVDIGVWESGVAGLLRNSFDVMVLGLRDGVARSNSVCYYRGLKKDILPMGYLLGDLPYREKCLVARMRLNALPLYCCSSRKEADWGCGVCASQVKEDMAHFFVVCPVYEDLRERFIGGTQLPGILGLRIPLGRIVGFIKEALKRRGNLLGGDRGAGAGRGVPW